MKFHFLKFLILLAAIQVGLADQCSTTVAVSFDAKTPLAADARLRLKAEVDGKPAAILKFSPGSKEERVLIVLDASGSMNAWTTVISEPNRWPAELDLAISLVENTPPGIAIGLLVFGDGKFKEIPITTDHSAIMATLDSLRSFKPHGKTDFSTTAEQARAMFNGRQVGDVILVLSDGVDNEPRNVRKLADLLAAEGIRLWGAILAAHEVHLQEPFIAASRATGGGIVRIEKGFSDTKAMREAGQLLASHVLSFNELEISMDPSSNKLPQFKLKVEDPPHVNAVYPQRIPACPESGARTP